MPPGVIQHSEPETRPSVRQRPSRFDKMTPDSKPEETTLPLPHPALPGVFGPFIPQVPVLQVSVLLNFCFSLSLALRQD